MDPGGERLILHAVDRGKVRSAYPAGLTRFDQRVSLFLSIAESPPAVGFYNFIVRSSHSRNPMTALLRSARGIRWRLGLRLREA
jgi:hypothetical protein